MTAKIYERALLLYREFPGRHAQVAAALSTSDKVCTAPQAKRLYEEGIPDLDLPPISSALRDEVRAVLGGEAGYDLQTGQPVGEAPAQREDVETTAAASACLNALSPADRKRERVAALKAADREREAKSDLEVRKIEAEARRAEAQAEASKQQAEADRARTERLKAESSAQARLASQGVANPLEVSLVERRAQEADVVKGLRDQLKVGSRIMGAMLITLANKAPEVIEQLKKQDVTFDEYTRMNRRLVSTAKDLAAIGDTVIKLERLIFGEPTAHISIESVGGEDPMAVLLGGIEAIRAAQARGVIECSAEDSERLAALTGGRGNEDA